MTGMTSRIIHSGRLPDLRNAFSTFRRLAIFLRRASLPASRISSRSRSRLVIDLDVGEELADRGGAHLGAERVRAVLLHRLPDSGSR